MDSLCLPGIHGISPSISVDVRANPTQVSAVGRSTVAQKTTSSGFSFKYSLKSLWPGGKGYYAIGIDDAVLVDNGEKGGDAVEEGVSGSAASEGRSESWVMKILHVRSRWREQEASVEVDQKSECDDDHEDDGDDEEEEEKCCDGCRVDDEEEKKEVQFDRDSFSRLLRRVSLPEAKLYAQMSYLGNLAYTIPRIKPGILLKNHGLRFVTSSVEKREMTTKAEKEQGSDEVQEAEADPKEAEAEEEKGEQKNDGHQLSASAAYQIAASAASYLHSRTRSILPFKSSKAEIGKDSDEGSNRSNDSVGIINSEVASFMATTDSVTAVVAAKEEVKQAVADDLNSVLTTPCEWFICDDDRTGTRFFVIQGSESLASWQANLLFEPISFEGLDVPVHRGIYEAAKGIYEQMLPEVLSHLQARGERATFRFTGHSLGGSLSLLVNLMLLIRGVVPPSSLLPVITFGAPSIMCGGDHLLYELGLPRSHVQAVTMHRDIVPRAFSCNYPRHVAELLKAVNGNFRNHPCLNNQKVLYSPMGEFLILQPEEKHSPHHHLLPSGSGLYLLSRPVSDANDAERQLLAAKLVFLNSPHPLEILSDSSAYGSDGTIQRDHDMKSYLRSVRSVIRQEQNSIRKTKREQRRKVWWPIVAPGGIHAGVIVGSPMVSNNMGQDQFNFSGILQTGRESLKRFSRLVASQHMHLLVVLLFPTRLFLLTDSMINSLTR
ncbi:hypothetical protein VitviT2T_009586 [Vitis vinifera]|uniref:Fungal lipase-type domain-containing protein n=1 Tax=Vitis vinifera TaxID=29760 RepID=A0ABY9C6W5_VITVI|nr:phospholipase A1 PLIP2, chloroplastic [Vitis vinifera]WJZ90443.1 hypothetical protein VitviT2T_009586 [Vitis vinifera]|eukprot:XP_002270132.1 PREDICTED: uncharacterized protein LOC100267577 [Vitis vinifera]